MTTKEGKVLPLRDLEGQRLFAAVVTLAGLGAAIYGIGSLLKMSDTALSQISELSGRVDHLSRPVVTSASEPAKT